MRLAHVISRRPHLIDQAVATALSFADHVVVGVDGFATKLTSTDITVVTGDNYVDITNQVLAYSAALGDCTLRIDDDDHYPDNHGRILDQWEPGSAVWGLTTVKGCDGRILRHHHPDICAGVLPTGITVTADAKGRIANSIRDQTTPIVVATGVIKQVCLADQAWVHSTRWQQKVTCRHEQRARAGQKGPSP